MTVSTLPLSRSSSHEPSEKEKGHAPLGAPPFHFQITRPGHGLDRPPPLPFLSQTLRIIDDVWNKAVGVVVAVNAALEEGNILKRLEGE